MPKFVVGIREVWTRFVIQEARDESGALNLVDTFNDPEKELDFGYSHRLSPTEWTVREATEREAE